MKFEILPLVIDPKNRSGVIEVVPDAAEFFGVYIFSHKENEFVWVDDFASKQAADEYIQHRLKMH